MLNRGLEAQNLRPIKLLLQHSTTATSSNIALTTRHLYTMSFLTKPAARSIPRSPIAVARFRPFHTTGLRAALSESDTHRRVYSSKSPLDFAVIPYSCAAMLTQLPKKADEERQADIDHHKNDQLNKQKDGKGHWKGELASNSEAAVCSVGRSSCMGFVDWVRC